MNIQYIPPSEKLRPYIRSYFFVKTVEDYVEMDKCFPLATQQIVFYTKGVVTLTVAGQKYYCDKPLLCGQILRFFEFSATPGAKFMGIAFQPTGLYKMFGIDTRLLEDAHEPLQQYIRDPENRLKTIFTDSSIEEKVEAFNSFFETHLDKLYSLPPVVDTCIDEIHASQGKAPIAKLMQKYNFSRRYLEKHFLYAVGTTPAKYAKLYRFLMILNNMLENHLSRQEITTLFRYYDKSHFRRDFEYFMGEKVTSDILKKYPFLSMQVKKFLSSSLPRE